MEEETRSVVFINISFLFTKQTLRVGYTKMFYTGRLLPRSKTLTQSYTRTIYDRKDNAWTYTFDRKWHPFTYPQKGYSIFILSKAPSGSKGRSAEPHTHRKLTDPCFWFFMVMMASNIIHGRGRPPTSPQHGSHTPEIGLRLWLTSAYIFDIGHPCHGQLTAVKTRYPLTSFTWPYHGSHIELIEVECFFEFTADQVMVYIGSRAQGDIGVSMYVVVVLGRKKK